MIDLVSCCCCFFFFLQEERLGILVATKLDSVNNRLLSCGCREREANVGNEGSGESGREREIVPAQQQQRRCVRGGSRNRDVPCKKRSSKYTRARRLDAVRGDSYIHTRLRIGDIMEYT